MEKNLKIDVSPQLLRWACAQAGYTEKALTRKFPKLDKWLRREDQPTLEQLKHFADATHVPLGFFFLLKFPDEPIPIPDFRTAGNIHISYPSFDLLNTIYLCQQRQEWYREYALSLGDLSRTFVGSVHLTDDIIKTAENIRETLGFGLKDRSQLSTWADSLQLLIEKADSLGILVMFSDKSGSNNGRKLNPAEFRGFALSDTYAPLVFINGAEAEAIYMFILAFELSHIWLGQSALSDVELRSMPENDVEKWCNAVAAELLVPLEVFRDLFKPHKELHQTINQLAQQFKVSTLLILRRLYDTGHLNREQFLVEYQSEFKRQRRLPGLNNNNFYRTIIGQVGKRFARAMITATMEGNTSFIEARRLLGFKKMNTFQKLSKDLGVI